MQKKSDEELKANKYNDDQIYAIWNFDGSEEMMALSSAVCNVWLTCSSYSYDETITLRKQSYEVEFGAKAVYGHSFNTFNSPGITVGISGSGPTAGITFTFSNSQEQADESYINPQLSSY